MTVVGFVPAKGHSERVPRKNLRLLNGEPLLSVTLRLLRSCEAITDIYVQTDDAEIAKLALSMGCLVLPLTQEETALDGHGIFAHGVRAVPEADVYVQMMCTSPFIRVETIQQMIQQVSASQDSAALGGAMTGYLWQWRETPTIPNSQTLRPVQTEAMGLYVVAGPVAREHGRRIRGSSAYVHGDRCECLDIDTEEDFRLADLVAKGQHQEAMHRLNRLKPILSSAALADAGAGVVAHGGCPMFPWARVFGRAKTLSLRLKRTDDGSIYDALRHYEYVAQGDVLVVNHPCGDLAYFGELNARAALQRGAAGYVSNGPLRDRAGLAQLQFPCWAPRTTPSDVKDVACVESINEPVVMNGQVVEPHDLIFADADGVVVLPWRQAEAILAQAMAALDTERRIIQDMALGVSPLSLTASHGAF